ncbi:MAG: RNA methyltransferase [Gammaproteobacteria bacterium]
MDHINQNHFSNIRIVLVGTSHPGNIGATARAMKTMGLSRLYLVTPKKFPDHEATARASGADDILASAQVFSSLPEALTGCGMVVATTARMRSMQWPIMEPKGMAKKVIGLATDNECALVFGHERSGLSNEELAHCHAAVMIPTEKEFSSLNLAAAVQILVYEIRQAILDLDVNQDKSNVIDQEALATSEQMENFYEHLEKTMIDIDFFDPKNPKHLMHRFRRLFNRCSMEQSEVQIMRGLLTASQKMVQKLATSSNDKAAKKN